VRGGESAPFLCCLGMVKGVLRAVVVGQQLMRGEIQCRKEGASRREGNGDGGVYSRGSAGKGEDMFGARGKRGDVC
jgi:hypothetical protein